MKSYLECLEEAALKAGDIDLSTEILLSLDEDLLELLDKAADIYASQKQGSINTNVVRPVSEGAVGGELLATEAQDTVAARGTCEHECTGPWDCQCQDVIDAFYRGVERKSSEGQL